METISLPIPKLILSVDKCFECLLPILFPLVNLPAIIDQAGKFFNKVAGYRCIRCLQSSGKEPRLVAQRSGKAEGITAE